jgi:hypothetical protein
MVVENKVEVNRVRGAGGKDKDRKRVVRKRMGERVREDRCLASIRERDARQRDSLDATSRRRHSAIAAENSHL